MAYPKCRAKPLSLWRIPEARLLDPAFLYMWGKVTADQEEFHNGSLCYESLVGHLCGDHLAKPQNSVPTCDQHARARADLCAQVAPLSHMLHWMLIRQATT